MKFILGKKIEMSQVFKGTKAVPVTLIEAGPCFVTQIKKKEKDGYRAVQIGFQKNKKGKFQFKREFRISENEDFSFKEGDKIDISFFGEGERVKISGTSKGKGFQGAVKRWGFKEKGDAHGIKRNHRTLGSVGTAGEGKVNKGRKMPGHMGHERKSIRGVQIVEVRPEKRILAFKGALPGARGSLIEIYSEGEFKKEEKQEEKKEKKQSKEGAKKEEISNEKTKRQDNQKDSQKENQKTKQN